MAAGDSASIAVPPGRAERRMQERFLGRFQGKGSTGLCGAGKLGHGGAGTPVSPTGKQQRDNNGRRKDLGKAGGTREPQTSAPALTPALRFKGVAFIPFPSHG